MIIRLLFPALITCLIYFTFITTSYADVNVIKPYEAGIFESNYADFKPGEVYISGKPQSITQTNSIPAKLGTKFGVRYQLNGHDYDKPLRVKLLYLTPGIIDPYTGKRNDKIEVVQDLAPDTAYHLIAYEFTEQYEIVPGEWQMYIFVEDQILIAEKFFVK